MKNEAEIEKIANQEQKVSNVKTYLIILFFLISAAVIVIFFSVLFNRDINDKYITKILATFISYAVLLAGGYLYNRALSKKLDKLWNQKKSLF
jgi:hypothetical protein